MAQAPVRVDNDSLEGDWITDDFDSDSFFIDAAAEVAFTGGAAGATQLSDDDLRKAKSSTIHSIALFGLSAYEKFASIKEGATVSALKRRLALTAHNRATQNTAQNVEDLKRRLESDPASFSTRAAIQDATDFLSLRNTYEDFQLSENAQNRRESTNFELQEYDKPIMMALHSVFYDDQYLPCTCGNQVSCLSTQYICALRLDDCQLVPGNDDHFFFDSVIAETAETGTNVHSWTPVQFHLPRSNASNRIDEASSDPEVDTNATAQDVLDDFCKVLDWEIRGFRVFVTQDIRIQRFCWSLEQSFAESFPEQSRPMSLFRALTEDRLSPHHRVHLAFVLSKAIWQYYDPLWMNMSWTLETIQFLQTPDLELETPFLRMISTDSTHANNPEHQKSPRSDGVPPTHRYPFILNLGLLLVQLGSITSEKTDIIANASNLIGTKKNNKVNLACCKELIQKNWPLIGLPQRFQTRYRGIVEQCLPTGSTLKPLFESSLDLAGRRLALKEHVVRPLFDLCKDMADKQHESPQIPELMRRNSTSVLQAQPIAARQLMTPSDHATEWVNKLVTSWLSTCVISGLESGSGHSDFVHGKRPKIALIDTGFDSKANFVDGLLKQRLRNSGKQYNWRDFWKGSSFPRDSDGHGTAMLSIIHRIAPFADICVARIASNDDDLKSHKEKTCGYVAEAIKWAVEIQNADIVSLSFGWAQEPSSDGKPAISNAISEALAHRDQKVLIFAAASNKSGSTYELFPATHASVFSIRGTNTFGTHQEFNPSFHPLSGDVFGTLGVQVPARNRNSEHVPQNGTSVATAVMAGIAATMIGYISLPYTPVSWDNIRVFHGFQKLLYELSTEPERGKRFVTLENHLEKGHETALKTALDHASDRTW